MTQPGHSAPGSAFASAPLSVVVPLYNEAGQVARLHQALRQGFPEAQLIFIDDGSEDDTYSQIRMLAEADGRLEVASLGRRRGKGAAVREGMAFADGDLVLMTDADLSVPLDELPKLVAVIDAGADIAIGSRDMPDSLLDPPQPWFRRKLASGFRRLRRSLLLPELRDTQCGFKLFRRGVARDLFPRATVDGFAFDIEILALAEALGYRVAEVGVTWRNDPCSRVRVVRDGVRMVRDLRRIRGIVRQVARDRAGQHA